MRFRAYAFFMLAALPLLCGCGFKLHTMDATTLSDQIFYVEYDEKNRDFSQSFIQSIAHENLKITDNSRQATVTFKIADTRVSIKSPSFNASHKMRVYSVAFEVQYSVLKDDTLILANQSITLNKNVVIRANETLQSTDQLKNIMLNIYKEAADQLLAQLAIKA